MRRVEGSVPVRLDLAGGTLDIWPIHLTLPEPGVTVNVAVDLPARVVVEPRDDRRVLLRSRDRGESAEHADLAALRRALAAPTPSPVRLLAMAVDAIAPPGGLSLTTDATSPAGAGLGGSSALLACVVATLWRAVGREASLEDVRRLAQDLETAVIHGPTGYQDYYPALHGGCLALEGRPGGVAVERLPVDADALSARLRLVYTGAPRLSGVTNWGALKAWFDREPATQRAMLEIAGIARDLRAALRRGDLDRALHLVVEEGAVRTRLAPGIATDATRTVDAAARAAGALGTKVMGAGGGGCVLVVCRDGPAPHDLDAALDAALASFGGRRLPCRVGGEGLVLRDGSPATAPGPARPLGASR
jgi:D-glycero-alpha-D-manno-heptose-7-phosphate kinase